MKWKFHFKIWFQKMKGKNQMKHIGKYNRVDCYECTQEEYELEYKRGLDACIYIIDGVMVKK